ncbi:MAG: hypothetical protein FWE37_09495 [Spirochaetaceae bacterium]|nr:hypothetical protein [Spirochaetaceae bacterium]
MFLDTGRVRITHEKTPEDFAPGEWQEVYAWLEFHFTRSINNDLTLVPLTDLTLVTVTELFFDSFIDGELYPSENPESDRTNGWQRFTARTDGDFDHSGVNGSGEDISGITTNAETRTYFDSILKAVALFN